MCKAAGSNLTAVCVEVRVQRAVLERWKYKTPTVIEEYLAATDKQAHLEALNKVPRALEMYLAIVGYCKANKKIAVAK